MSSLFPYKHCLVYVVVFLILSVTVLRTTMITHHSWKPHVKNLPPTHMQSCRVPEAKLRIKLVKLPGFIEIKYVSPRLRCVAHTMLLFALDG